MVKVNRCQHITAFDGLRCQWKWWGKDVLRMIKLWKLYEYMALANSEEEVPDERRFARLLTRLRSESRSSISVD